MPRSKRVGKPRTNVKKKRPDEQPTPQQVARVLERLAAEGDGTIQTVTGSLRGSLFDSGMGYGTGGGRRVFRREFENY